MADEDYKPKQQPKEQSDYERLRRTGATHNEVRDYQRRANEETGKPR